MKRGLAVLALVACFTVAGVAVAQVALEEPVLTGPKNQRNPALGEDGLGQDVLSFTRSRDGSPNRYDAYARKGDGTVVKLNEAGQGWTGGMDYPVVAYQQISGGQSDIYFYDLETDTDATHPVPVNRADRWEWHPSVAGSITHFHVLFGQDNLNSPTQRVVLHEHPAHVSLVLEKVTQASHYVQPDQLNGDFATYTRCKPNCNVVRYQISTGEKLVLPKPVMNRPRQQYAAGVSPDGAVYFVRSGPRCGEKVKIVRFDPARSDPTFGTVLAALPSGLDIAFAFLHERVDDSRNLVYDRVNCSTGRFDVYKVTDPAGP
jgi:hypothetical protein